MNRNRKFRKQFSYISKTLYFADYIRAFGRMPSFAHSARYSTRSPISLSLRLSVICGWSPPNHQTIKPNRSARALGSGCVGCLVSSRVCAMRSLTMVCYLRSKSVTLDVQKVPADTATRRQIGLSTTKYASTKTQCRTRRLAGRSYYAPPRMRRGKYIFFFGVKIMETLFAL